MSTIAEQYVLQGIEKGIAQGIEKGIEKGIAQGIEKGIERGELIGMIRTCQSNLNVTELSDEEMRSMTIEALKTMAGELSVKLRLRLGN